MGKYPDLPKGYKERSDALIVEIMPLAEKLLDMAREFGCNNFDATNGVVKISIEGSGSFKDL